MEKDLRKERKQMKTGYNRYTRKPTNPNNFYIDPKELSCEIRKS